MSSHDYLIFSMEFSLGQRLRATRQGLGFTQERVIDELKNRYGVTLSEQALSCIKNGKRKVDAERELPALAAVYGKPIDSFYDLWQLPEASRTRPDVRAIASLDFDALTKQDKLELAAELISNVLEST